MTTAGRRFTAVRSSALAYLALMSGCALPPAPAAPNPPPLFTADQFRAPATLAEALRALERLLTADMQSAMRRGGEEQMLDYHHSVGRWIRNEWMHGREDQALTRWFERTYGIRDSEEISGIVLRSFWRHLNDRPLDVEGQVREVRAWNEKYLRPSPPPPLVTPKP